MMYGEEIVNSSFNIFNCIFDHVSLVGLYNIFLRLASFLICWLANLAMNDWKRPS